MKNKAVNNPIATLFYNALQKLVSPQNLSILMSHCSACKKGNPASGEPLHVHKTFKIATLTGSIYKQLHDIAYFEYVSTHNATLWYVVLSNNERIALKWNTTANSILESSGLFTQINKNQIINMLHLSWSGQVSCTLHLPIALNHMHYTVTRSYMKEMNRKCNIL